MKKNKSEIVVVCDRSGSMSSIKGDMEGGFKTFLKEQKKEPGEAYVTYYQFDNEFEKVFEAKPLAEVDSINIQPRGITALVDAIGRSTNEVGQRLEKTPEEDRPESVIVVVITDGMENASHEYTSEKVREMIKHQEDNYNWRYLFLGSNIDAVQTGGFYGFDADASLTFGNNKKGIDKTFGALSKSVSAYRSCADYSFSVEEREEAMGDE